MKPHTLKLFLLFSLLTLAACDIQSIKPDAGTSETREPATDTQLSFARYAEDFVELAEDSINEDEQQAYRIKAGKLFIDAGNIQQAKEQLAILQEQLESKIASNKNTDALKTSLFILSAEIAIAERNAVTANHFIKQIKPVNANQKTDLLEVRANYDSLSGNYMSAVNRRVKLDTQLTNETDKNRNSQKIWNILSSMPTTQLAGQRSKDPITSGWLDLAKLMRSGQQNVTQLENNLLDWGTNNPEHPFSNNFLSELIDDYQFNTSAKKHIAILLPMQGKLAKITGTIKNGVLSAYYNDPNTIEKPTITFYDSSDESITFQELYQQALTNGATNIIGPINKTIINQLMQQRELDVPVLTLNYSENTFSDTENLFQFGLSPEDEARQVAELAITQNKKRAAIFYPDSDWGRRLKEAFTQRYEGLGGRVLTTIDYATNSKDYRRPIRTLFNLDQSAIRRTKVENTLSQKVLSEPHRRQDIDMIFLAATHSSARGIMPAFKFHHAGSLPVYSTSHVYTGRINRELDRDLNGIIFCDLPWVLQNTSPLEQTFEKNWPKQKNLTRLFALGVDAYHLIYNLDYLANNEYAFYDGLTGNIQLDSSNRITRKSLWAKFKKGQAVYFEPTIDQ